MRKIRYCEFLIGLYGIIFLLLFCAIYYNKNYFLKIFFSEKTSLPSAYSVLIVSAQILLVAAALLIYLFRRKIYTKRKEFALLLGTLILLFLILEIGSRFYVCNFAGYNLKSKILFPNQCGLAPKFSPHHYLNYQGTPGYVSLDGLNMHNSLGFRGREIEMPKPDGVYRIVTFGGSTTYSVGVNDWKKDFARQLEKELKSKFNYDKIEVINAGLGGWTSWESLINLEFKVLDLEPDLIIVYHGGNDIFPRLVDPQDYKGDNSGYRRQWERRKIPLFFHSVFFRLVTGTNPVGLGSYVNNPHTPRENDAEIKELFLSNKPIYFERNLRNMIAIAKEYDIEALLVTWAHNKNLRDYPEAPYLEYGIKEHNEIVKKVGDSHNVPVYDYVSEMPLDEEYWLDGTHLTEEGIRLKAELFTDYIYNEEVLSNRILKQKSSDLSGRDRTIHLN